MNRIAKIASALSIAVATLGGVAPALAINPDQTLVVVGSPTTTDAGLSTSNFSTSRKVGWQTAINAFWADNDVTSVTGGAGFTRKVELYCTTSGGGAWTTVVNAGGASVFDDNFFLGCASGGTLVGARGTLTVNN